MHFRSLQLHNLVCDLPVCGAERCELRRWRKVTMSRTFGEQARTLGKKRQIVAREGSFGRFELRRGEFDQNLASRDVLALADVNRGDRAPVFMLHGLPVPGD